MSKVGLGGAEGAAIFERLKERSGLMCEARTASCLAPGGRMEGNLSRRQVSIQHRRARGAGGTSVAETNNLANLLLICGDGVIGCHGEIETLRRGAARGLGLWVPHEYEGGAPTPIERYPVRIGAGRWRLLHPSQPWYVELPLHLQYSATTPDCAVHAERVLSG